MEINIFEIKELSIMTGFKAYVIMLFIGLINISYSAIEYHTYSYNFVLMTTVTLTSLLGSWVQVSHKKNDYNIKAKEVIAIFSTGFLFAYVAYILGDTLYSYQRNEVSLLNPLHIAGFFSVVTSYFSIKTLKLIQFLVHKTLSGISINLIKGVTGFLLSFLKEKDNGKD